MWKWTTACPSTRYPAPVVQCGRLTRASAWPSGCHELRLAARCTDRDHCADHRSCWLHGHLGPVHRLDSPAAGRPRRALQLSKGASTAEVGEHRRAPCGRASPHLSESSTRTGWTAPVPTAPQADVLADPLQLVPDRLVVESDIGLAADEVLDGLGGGHRDRDVSIPVALRGPTLLGADGEQSRMATRSRSTLSGGSLPIGGVFSLASSP